MCIHTIAGRRLWLGCGGDLREFEEDCQHHDGKAGASKQLYKLVRAEVL